MPGSPVTSVRRQNPSDPSGRRLALWHEGRELALQRLGDARTPALNDGSRGGIGEELLLSVLKAIENGLRRRCRRGLWNFEPPIHIGIHWAQNDGMRRHS